jgi:hypothetical protein
VEVVRPGDVLSGYRQLLVEADLPMEGDVRLERDGEIEESSGHTRSFGLRLRVCAPSWSGTSFRETWSRPTTRRGIEGRLQARVSGTITPDGRALHGFTYVETWQGRRETPDDEVEAGQTVLWKSRVVRRVLRVPWLAITDGSLRYEARGSALRASVSVVDEEQTMFADVLDHDGDVLEPGGVSLSRTTFDRYVPTTPGPEPPYFRLSVAEAEASDPGTCSNPR